MIFEWDEHKNRLNIHKHGVSFEDAETVFKDEFAVYLTDDEHSIDEERFTIIGVDLAFKILYVCYCIREKGEEEEEVTRIISARKATKSESKLYEEGLT